MIRPRPQAWISLRLSTAAGRAPWHAVALALAVSVATPFAEGCGDDDGPRGTGRGDGGVATVDGAVGADGAANGDADIPAGDGGPGPMPGCDDARSGPAPEIVECPDAPATGAGVRCEITPGDASRLFVGDVLVPGRVFHGGSVHVGADGRIACVGCDCAAGAASATRVTCPGAAISPSFLNAHDHITYAQNPPYTRTAERYEHRHDWRRGGRGHTEVGASGGASADEMAWGELRMVLGGATSLNGSGGTGGFLRNLDRNEDAMAVMQGRVRYQTFPLGDSDGTLRESGCGYSEIDTTAEVASSDAYTPHVAEGIDGEARNEFLCMRSGANDLVLDTSAFIHGVGLLPPDIAEMAADGTGLIWSPRSNVTLYGDTARVTTYARLGVPIALGTDWLPSGSMNVLRELTCAADLNERYMGRFFTDEALWLMATKNAADALGVGEVLGSLEVGKVADLAIFAGGARRDHAAVLRAGAADVIAVLRGGAALYGDAPLVAALRTDACDTLDVCGIEKRVCVAAEIEKDLAALTAANDDRYPLFFCGEPENEPSCLPARDAMAPLPDPSVDGSGRYTGMSTADDRDGDGVPDATDLCACVFDPARPVDRGSQADWDADGVGDACDPCPFDPGSATCAGWNAGDRDGDGVPDDGDTCPSTFDPSQADRDADGVGDACDACPETPNTMGGACPATVYEIKGGEVAVGAEVSVSDLVVTGVGANGFFAQLDATSALYRGVERSGVFIFTGAAPSVAAGDRVTLASSTVNDFYGQIQLTNADVRVTGSGAPAPVAVDATIGAAGIDRAADLEGTLVRVASVSVTNAMPARGRGDADPTYEFEITGGVRVDDFLYRVEPAPVTGATFDAISGVLAFRNDAFKLEPRGAADVVTGAPVLLALEPALSFARVGDGEAPTSPEPLVARLSGPATAPMTITLTSSDPAGLAVGDVEVPMGADRVEIPVDGQVASATPYVVTASLDGRSSTANVRVLGAAELPSAITLAPAAVATAPGSTVSLRASLDVPAPAGGLSLAVTIDGDATGPATVMVPVGALAASFDVVVGGPGTVEVEVGSGAITATATVSVTDGPLALVINEIDYDQPGAGDALEFVEIFNGTGGPVDLASHALVFVNGANSAEYDRIELSGTLAAGGYLVVANSGVTVPGGVPRLDLSRATDAIQNGPTDAVMLVDVATRTVIDAVTYASESGGGMAIRTTLSDLGAVVAGEGMPAGNDRPAMGNGSLARTPNGRDTNDNASDFAISVTPSPGASN